MDLYVLYLGVIVKVNKRRVLHSVLSGKANIYCDFDPANNVETTPKSKQKINIEK